jgi:hypothetical protein
MANLAVAAFADPFSSLAHLRALPVLLVLGYRWVRGMAGGSTPICSWRSMSGC